MSCLCRFSLFFLLLPAILAGAGCARPALVTGELAGDVVWSGTVRLRGDVIVPQGVRLRIAPGTMVLFLPPRPGEDRWTEHPHFTGSELIVRGTVTAEGEATAPIVFRHQDAHAPAGSWGGINLQQGAEAVFRHCLFTQADSAVHSQESTVTVEESTFRRNLVGLRFHSSAIRIERNLLADNGTAIRFHFGAPVIVGNCIRENEKGMFVTAEPRDFRIEGNDFIANREFNVVLGEEVPDDLPMPQNWWGSRDPQTVESGFFDGRRESHLGRIIYRPQAAGAVAGSACSR